jgi:ribonuclease BN (tRNA processing enzyme)
MGQKGTDEILNVFQNHPFTMQKEDLPFRETICELPEDADRLPFPCRVLPLVHADPTLGIRFILDNKTIAYCTDTGYCDNAVELARDADILFTECAYPPGFERKEWPHLNPESAARIASESGAKRLVLIHFDAHNYRDKQSRYEAQTVAREIFPQTEAGFDDMVIEL